MSFPRGNLFQMTVVFFQACHTEISRPGSERHQRHHRWSNIVYCYRYDFVYTIHVYFLYISDRPQQLGHAYCHALENLSCHLDIFFFKKSSSIAILESCSILVGSFEPKVGWGEPFLKLAKKFNFLGVFFVKLGTSFSHPNGSLKIFSHRIFTIHIISLNEAGTQVAIVGINQK